MCVMFSDVRVVWLCDSFGLCVWGDSRIVSLTGSATCHVDTTLSRVARIRAEAGGREVWVLFSDVRVVWLCDSFGLCVWGDSARCHLDWIGDISRRHDLPQSGAVRRR